MLTLTSDDDRALALVDAIRRGDLDRLERLLGEHEGLAGAWIGDRKGGSRSSLHVVTDWPGYFPNGPQVVSILVDAGPTRTQRPRTVVRGRRRFTGRPAATTSTSPTR